MILSLRSHTNLGVISKPFCGLLAENVAQHQPNTNPNKVQQKQMIGSHFTQRFADESLVPVRITCRCSSSSCGLKKSQASPQAFAYRSSNTWATSGGEPVESTSRGEEGVDEGGSSIALLFASNCLSASSCLSNAALNRDTGPSVKFRVST